MLACSRSEQLVEQGREVERIAEPRVGVEVQLLVGMVVQLFGEALLLPLPLPLGIGLCVDDHGVGLRRGKRHFLLLDGPVVFVGLQIVGQREGVGEVQAEVASGLFAGSKQADGTAQAVDQAAAGHIAAEHADGTRGKRLLILGFRIALLTAL